MSHAPRINAKGEGPVGVNTRGVWNKNVSAATEVETYENEAQ
jgi:hypothetical protein